MLILPDGPRVYRVFAIDPGTDTLGIAVMDIDLRTYKISLIFSRTLKASKELKKYVQIAETLGDRHAKIISHGVAISKLLDIYKPNCVISESPYMGSFAQAFEALVECLMVIRETVFKYDPSMSLETIDPPNVKKAVGAPGKGGDKDLVKIGVMKLSNLENKCGIPLEDIDNHSIDAIAVGYYKLKTLFNL